MLFTGFATAGIIQIRLGITAYAGATNYYKNASHKLNALEYYNIEHRVNKLLHGWSNDMYFNPLNRVKLKTERRNDGFNFKAPAEIYTRVNNVEADLTEIMRVLKENNLLP